MNEYSCAAPDLNLDPQHYSFWMPPDDRSVLTGADQTPVPLPQIPLPLERKAACREPSDNVIGNGVYDYLRRFPECPHGVEYAELLRDAYPHFLADLAANLVMLDAKEVEPAYILRKLSGLRVLRLLEPENTGLLWQLAQGYYGLAMLFSELPRVRRHLLDAMRFGLELVRKLPDHPSALNLLAEIDLLFGDYPSACVRLRRLLAQLNDPGAADRIAEKLRACEEVGYPDHPRIDDLEAIGEAMLACGENDFDRALYLLERLEVDDDFLEEFSSADFFYMLGRCRLETGDRAGAFEALSRSLTIAPDHELARSTLDSF